MFTKNLNYRFGLFAIILLILVLVNACSPPQGPLNITDISVDPDPIIGQTATLQVEVMSRRDEPDTTILIDLPPGVKLMKGELTWEGSLTANQPQSHEIAICVFYEGDWRVWMSATSPAIKGERLGSQDSETLHIITTADSVRVVRNKDYRITQPPGGMVHPTAVPETSPTDICQ